MQLYPLQVTMGIRGWRVDGLGTCVVQSPSTRHLRSGPAGRSQRGPVPSPVAPNETLETLLTRIDTVTTHPPPDWSAYLRR